MPEAEPAPVRRMRPQAVEVPADNEGIVRTIASPRPAAAPAPIYKSEPKRFNEAREVADRFKEGTAVIMNLQETEDSIARRLVDFAAGLVYGHDGKIELVANRVYLLTPRQRRGLGGGTSAAGRRRLLQPVLTVPRGVDTRRRLAAGHCC